MQNIEKLENIKSFIENMSKYHQIEILKILSKNLCKINENKSGVYVNLSFLPNETIDEMEEYIMYTKEQEENLKTLEYQKEEFKNAFFNSEKQDKDNNTYMYNTK
uniref:NET domain-containing protein n=1 Tax=viral metagenome TaxID=1070528 RepID=A0A6C0LRA2_9ZZZZ